MSFSCLTDMNELASDQEFPLSLAILVNDKKKDAMKKANADRKKLNLIDKKNKPKGKQNLIKN